jgi:hypothetical protein
LAALVLVFGKQPRNLAFDCLPSLTTLPPKRLGQQCFQVASRSGVLLAGSGILGPVEKPPCSRQRFDPRTAQFLHRLRRKYFAISPARIALSRAASRTGRRARSDGESILTSDPSPSETKE